MIFKKTCKICGVGFESESNVAKYCNKCRRLVRKADKKRWEDKNCSLCIDCGKKIFRLSTRCLSCANKGNLNPSWKGGRIVTVNGYIWIYSPNHPFANSSGYVMEHRLVVEEDIGKYLDVDVLAHHINGKRDDNRLSNLKVVTKKEHSNLHRNFQNGRFEIQQDKV